MTDTLLNPEQGESTTASPTQEPIIKTQDTHDWSKALNADGTFTQDAYDFGVPGHFKSFGAFNKSYKELQRVKGAPGDEATAEQIKAFREANGVPEITNAEAYGIELPDGLKEVYQPESLDRIVKVANENAHFGHVAMLKAVINEFSTMEMQGMADLQKASEEAQAAKLEANAKLLEEDKNFSGSNKNAALQTSANALNAALDALGVDPSSDEAREVARSPLMIRILHHYGSKTSQDGMNLGALSADLRSGEEQANDIMTNPANPEYKLYHEGDERIGKKVLALMGAR